MLDFHKATPPTVITKFQPTLCAEYGYQGGIEANIAWGDLPHFKHYGTLKVFLTQDHMGLEISKRYSSYTFPDPNTMKTQVAMGECRLFFFLAIGQVLKLL